MAVKAVDKPTARQINAGPDLTTGSHRVLIDGANDAFTLVTGAWWQMVAAYPLGQAWDASVPVLRVQRYEIKAIAPGKWHGTVFYSTESRHDIDCRWGPAAMTIETCKDRAGNVLGVVPGTDGKISKVATRHAPASTFIYTRTESDLGYFDGGNLVPWPGGLGRPSWGATSVAPDSQRKTATELAGSVNSVSFLGDDSEKWMFVTASAMRELTGKWADLFWRVSYEFAYRAFRGHGWRWRDVQNGDDLRDIEDAMDFASELVLTWPADWPGGGGSL